MSPLTSMDLGCGTKGSDLDLQNAGYVFIEVRPQTQEQPGSLG
ncbi:hypothetical protein [Nocardioides convexus]|nr:hypothetical protein [Nocardioides convexus]